MDSLSLPLITFQAVSPKQRTAWVYISFFQKCHPLLYQKTRCRSIFRINIKVIIPRFGGGRSCRQSHLPVCRMTRRRSISFSSVIPRLSDDEMSKMSSPVCLVQRCHQSKCLFSTNHQFKYIPKFPNVYSIFCFPFIYLHTTINTVVDNPFPQ